MPGFSWDNPFPFYLDDGPTEYQLAYDGLHEAAGVSTVDPTQSALAPKDPDPLTLSSIADLEVKAEALVIGAAATWVEHAKYEGIPGAMIDSLSAWERILGISPIAPTIAERQVDVRRAYTRIPDATPPGLTRALQAISPKLSLDTLNPDLWTITMFGKDFPPFPDDEGFYHPPYRTSNGLALFGRSNRWPAFSDAFVVRVRYMLEAGETQPPSRIITHAKDTLIEILPAWATFQVYTLSDDGSSGEGFYFDGGPDDDSFFDVTAFGET